MFDLLPIVVCHVYICNALRVRRLIAGTFLCSWWPYFDFFLANISIFNLVNIAVDRWQQTRVVTRVATYVDTCRHVPQVPRGLQAIPLQPAAAGARQPPVRPRLGGERPRVPAHPPGDRRHV